MKSEFAEVSAIWLSTVVGSLIFSTVYVLIGINIWDKNISGG